MKDRILKILQDKHLTSAKFADLIQVQRSSISHILSGRNKPSMDFLQKVLTTFDDISGDWLITGLGDMYKDGEERNISKPEQESTVQSPSSGSLFNTLSTPRDVVFKENKAEVDAQSPIHNVETQVETKPQPEKKIKRIIIYYSDNSFEELYPAGK